MAEAKVVDIARDILREKYPSFTFSREGTANPEVEKMLASASKKGSGQPGRPDIIGVRTEYQGEGAGEVILVEVKASSARHGSFPVAEGGPDMRATHAIPGIIHYMRSAWDLKRSAGMAIVGIAISGVSAEGQFAMVNVFGVAGCNSACKEPVIRDLGFREIPSEERCLELLYSLKGWPGSFALPRSSGQVILLPSEAIPKLEVSTEINRKFSPTQADDIYKYLLKLKEEDREIFIPGIIIIGVCDGKYYILDGQHRLSALTRFEKQGNSFSFLVQLVPCATKGDLREVYTSHYLALEATPAEVALEATGEEELARDVCDRLAGSFPDQPKIFGRSATCPFIKTVVAVERLRALFVEQPELAEEGVEALVAQVLRKNAKMRKTPPVTSAAGVVYASRTMDLCKRSGCYLGLLRPEDWFGS